MRVVLIAPKLPSQLPSNALCLVGRFGYASSGGERRGERGYSPNPFSAIDTTKNHVFERGEIYGDTG